MRQRIDEVRRHRIAGADRHHCGHIGDLAGERRRIAGDDEHIDLILHLVDHLAEFVDLSGRPARSQRQVLPRHITVPFQHLEQSRAVRRLFVERRAGRQRAETKDLVRALRKRRARPGYRRANSGCQKIRDA